MKIYAVIALILFLTMLFVPLFSLMSTGDTQSVFLGSAGQDVTKAEETQSAYEPDSASSVRVLRTSSGKVESVDMESYIICCVASEMPPSYQKEALKAQAVVSYTYALYLLSEPYSSQADITDDSSLHQAYKSENELKERWGDSYEENMKIIKEAVSEVEGEYLTYEGKIIKSAYHAMSAGKTNSALDAWGSDVPYLQAVTSDGDRLSPKFISTYDFSTKETVKILSGLCEEKISDIEIGDCVKNSGGYVKSIEISGVTFTGEKLRSAFSLRSGAFDIEKKGDTLTFTCEGYGHGVGMSQNGAEYMAQNGSTYDEILRHYYTGIEIKS